VPLQILPHISGAITDAGRLSTQLRNVQHLFHAPQAIRPLRVFRTGKRTAGKTAALLTAELIEKTAAPALASVLAIPGALVRLTFAVRPGIVAAALLICGSDLLFALTLSTLALL